MAQDSILCFGELLIDLVADKPGRLVETQTFLKKFGGAPANTSVGLSRLGNKVYFAGKVGADPFGLFLKQTLEENGVLTDYLVLDSLNHTTLAFVSLTKTGERDFTFFKGAHDLISEKEVRLPNNIKLFHFGSLTQVNPISKKATAKMLTQAIEKKAIISYDPNVREFLWIDLSKAQKVILETSKKVDILKVNEKEARLLSGIENLVVASQKLFNPNLKVLFVTMGAQGCMYRTPHFRGVVPTIDVKTIDTTGAGDAFNAGVLDGIANSKKRLEAMTKEELEQIIRRANIIASLSTTQKGAISAFPTNEEIAKYL